MEVVKYLLKTGYEKAVERELRFETFEKDGEENWRFVSPIGQTFSEPIDFTVKNAMRFEGEKTIEEGIDYILTFAADFVKRNYDRTME
jgi:hypothetical protein